MKVNNKPVSGRGSHLHLRQHMNSTLNKKENKIKNIRMSLIVFKQKGNYFWELLENDLFLKCLIENPTCEGRQKVQQVLNPLVASKFTYRV